MPRRILVVLACALALTGAFAASAEGRTRPNWHLGGRSLHLGMRGHDVRVLQDMLTRDGVRTHVDGVFGSGTLTSVRRFQALSGLPVVGVVGPQTVAALRSGRRVSANSTNSSSSIAGGAAVTTTPAAAPPPTGTATVGPDGLAVAPAGAPPAVVAMIAAGNQIAKLPYKWGGGHASWQDTGYDCSGSVSYVLHAAGLLDSSLDSTGLESWGLPGAGPWVTVYANATHTYGVIAGLRFDTSGQTAAGTRWQAASRSSAGFVVRHPAGL